MRDMRIVVFGDERRVGALDGGQVVDLNRAFAQLVRDRQGGSAEVEAASRVPPALETFISAGSSALDAAREVLERLRSAGAEALGAGAVLARSSVRLHAPWPGRRIACIGGNYAAHLAGMEASRGGDASLSLAEITANTRDKGQWGFWKVPVEVAGDGDTVPFPRRTRYLDYEGEAAIVLGVRGKDIPADRLAEHVWGVTLMNDWSIRDSRAPARPMSYNTAKNFDRSTSLGPCIVVGELDPSNVDVEVRLNGELRQQFNTRDMIFSFAEVLAFLSQDFTFVPGDVIAGGTGAGTAQDTSVTDAEGKRSTERFLKVGDTVEVSSPQIGAIANTLVAP